MGPYGSKKFQRHLLWMYISDSLPKPCLVIGRVFIKIFKELTNFRVWIFAIFSVFVNMRRFSDIASWKLLAVELNGAKFWVSGSKALVYVEYCWLKSLSSVWVHSVYFRFFDDVVSRKRRVVERTDRNLGLRGKYLVYTGYFWLLSVDVQLESFCAFPWNFETDSRRAKRTTFCVRGKYFSVYRALLTVQVQYGIIRCISSFWRPCIDFWLKIFRDLCTAEFIPYRYFYLARDQAARQKSNSLYCPLITIFCIKFVEIWWNCWRSSVLKKFQQQKFCKVHWMTPNQNSSIRLWYKYPTYGDHMIASPKLPSVSL